MEQLNVITKRVDVLPMVKYYIDQLGIYGLFSKYVKKPSYSAVSKVYQRFSAEAKTNKPLRKLLTELRA